MCSVVKVGLRVCAMMALGAAAATLEEVRLDDWDSAEMVGGAEAAAAEAELGAAPGSLLWLDRRFARERAAAPAGGGSAKAAPAAGWPDTLYADGNEHLYGAVEAAGGGADSPGRKGKRSDGTDQVYDYEQLRAEYEQAAGGEMNYTTEQPAPGTGLAAAVGRIVDVRRPRNCSAEGVRNYGPRALLCLLRELRAARSSSERRPLVVRLAHVAAFWLLVWAAVAVPFWCHKGWCCCCLQPCFAFCRPRSSLRHVRAYLARNPPGTLHTPDGRVLRYEPSKYEVGLYQSMERQVRRVLLA